MKCLFIYNKNSGKGKYKKKKDYIIRRLKKRFKDVEFSEPNSKEEFLDVLKKCSKYDYLIFSGGDGTVNDVLNAVIKSNKKPILGYIPSGTVNDFASSLSIPKNLNKALNIIEKGSPKNVDAFLENDRYGVYICASGIFTSASYKTEQTKKQKVGKWAYYVDSFREVFSAKAHKIDVEIGDEKLSLNSVLFFLINSKSVAGYKFNKDADLNDGKMELVSVNQKKEKLTFGSLMLVLRMFLFGLKSVLKNKNITYKKFSNLKVKFYDDMAVNVDGENDGKHNVEIKVIKDAIKILSL
ncbi:MAG: YegS/Rv2252/BmrU family lipid kinase [Clostridia bacterium]|nr:YegS/Rv2252/BmrU family lipid kinase [Clostridia bacterium]